MKKFLLSLCVALLSCVAFAQTNVVVVLKDGTEVKYSATDIDSIRIEKGDSTQTDEEVVDAATSDFRFFVLNDKEAEVTGLNIASATVIVPAKVQIKGKVYTVTSIGDEAFSAHDVPSMAKIKQIILPNTITNIGEYAFYECSSLTSIEIPESVTEIGEYAFYECSSLTSIEIPNSVTTIEERAFEYCTSLTSIEIPNSVTYIGRNAFSDCESLTSIEIPNSVTYIGEEAFMGCTSLTSIVIPNSVTYIGSYAFSGCENLKTARAPVSLKGKIPSNAFPSTCEIEYY